jgi:ankyrin repeat protein
MEPENPLDLRIIEAIVNGAAVGVILSLLDEGANPDATHPFSGYTPLYGATRNCATEIAELLLKRGANPDFMGDEISYLGTPLIAAVGSESRPTCIPILKLLLQYGADVNKNAGQYHETALHSAVKANNIDACKLLIEAGADVNSQNFIGATPLHEACHKWKVDMCKFLIQSGANIEAEDFEGRTPIFSATPDGPIANLLYTLGANFLHRNKQGETVSEYFQRVLHMFPYLVFLSKQLEEKYKEKIASSRGLALVSAASQFHKYRPGTMALRTLPNTAVQGIANFLNLKNNLGSLKKGATAKHREKFRHQLANRNTRLAAARQAVATQHDAEDAEQLAKAAKEGWYGFMGGGRRKTRAKKTKRRRQTKKQR